MRDEAIQGKYQTDYGQVEIANSELSNLICYACLENWLVGLSPMKVARQTPSGITKTIRRP